MWPTDLLGGGGRRLTSPRETRSATSAAVRPRSASLMDRSVPGGGGAPPHGTPGSRSGHHLDDALHHRSVAQADELVRAGLLRDERRGSRWDEESRVEEP